MISLSGFYNKYSNKLNLESVKLENTTEKLTNVRDGFGWVEANKKIRSYWLRKYIMLNPIFNYYMDD